MAGSILVARIAGCERAFFGCKSGGGICRIGVEIALDCFGGYRYLCTAIALSFMVMKIYLV